MNGFAGLGRGEIASIKPGQQSPGRGKVWGFEAYALRGFN